MERSFLSTIKGLVGGGRASAGTAPATSPPPDETAAPPDSPNKVAYLSAMSIFRDLSPKEMQMVVDSTVMKTARKGRIIYMPEETGEVLFLLKKGTVHLYRLSSEGRKLIIETAGPMTFFGEMSFVGQKMYDLFAEAAEDCLVCVMSRADVERLILSKPQVALRMMEEIGRRMHDAQERLGDSAFKGIPARIASLLLKLSQDGARPVTGTRHQDLADMLGVYRETVSSTLGQLRDEGIIDLSRKEITILDAERLREKAEDETLRKR